MRYNPVAMGRSVKIPRVEFISTAAHVFGTLVVTQIQPQPLITTTQTWNWIKASKNSIVHVELPLPLTLSFLILPVGNYSSAGTSAGVQWSRR